MRVTLWLVVFLLGGAVALARAKGSSSSVDDPYEEDRSNFGALLSRTSPELPTNSPVLPDFSGMHKMKNFNPRKNGSNDYDQQGEESGTRSPKAGGSTGKKHYDNSTEQPVASEKKSKASTSPSKKDGKKPKKSSKKSSGKDTPYPTFSPTSTIAPTSSPELPANSPALPDFSGMHKMKNFNLRKNGANGFDQQGEESRTRSPKASGSTGKKHNDNSTEQPVKLKKKSKASTSPSKKDGKKLNKKSKKSSRKDTSYPTFSPTSTSAPTSTRRPTGAPSDSPTLQPSTTKPSTSPTGTLVPVTLTPTFDTPMPTPAMQPSTTKPSASPTGTLAPVTLTPTFGTPMPMPTMQPSTTKPSTSPTGTVAPVTLTPTFGTPMPTSAEPDSSPSAIVTPLPSTLVPTTPFPSSVPTSNFISTAPSAECQNPRYECCSDEECLVDGTTCANRNCVVQGAMRFTLTWSGLDDKNLQVQAPGGQPINSENPVDPVSGGTLEDNVTPTESDFRAENIFFPTDRPIIPGDYQVLLTGNSESEPWTITLTIDGIQVSSLTGTDLSRSLVVAVSAPPSKCDTSAYECCVDEDCQDGLACAARNCVMIGYPRFTLSWLGSDDKDLIVTTPDDTDIFFGNLFDPISGGRLEGDVVPDGFDFYAENIYFPVDGSAPAGVYEYLIRGNGEEPWNVIVALNFTVVGNVSGVGDQSFTYQFGEIAPTNVPVPVPTPAPSGFTPFPTGNCSSLLEDQCCESEDCQEMSSCSNRNCVRNGNPRFTLTWVGEGDKDIRVRTPDGTLIFFQNTFDPISGGMLEKDVVPDGGFGFYAENIYFPIDGSAPIGDYLYGVSGSGVEAWELSVYLGDEMVDVKKGTGPSEDFNYEFGICDREIAECCTDLDCRNSSEDNTGDLCVARNCIFDGVLRFTLIWEGIDDKDIAVILPNNSTIDFQSPNDKDSGCRLEMDKQPVEPGNHVENIYCPPGSSPPLGSYIYTARKGQEPWTLEVYVDGKLASSDSGSGDSPDLVFELL